MADTADASGGRQPTARDRGVYSISVAAELLGVGVQTLRFYESRGLLEPGRTAGGTRRYSEDDLARLDRITRLLGEGLNVSGIHMVLRLEDENDALRAENATLTARGDRAGIERPPRH